MTVAPLDPDVFARSYAARSPMHGAEGYGGPCCEDCRAEPRRRAGVLGELSFDEVVAHAAGCEWMRLRAHYGWPLRLVLDYALHAVVDDE